MYAAKVIVTVILAVLIQVVFSTWTGKRFNYVDLPLIVTVYFSLRRSQLLGMAVGMTSGLAHDALAHHPIIGPGGVTRTVIGYLVSTLSLRFELDNFLMRLLILGVGAGAHRALFILINKLLSVPGFMEITNRELWRVVGITAAVNLGVGLFIFLILDKLIGRPDPGKVETGRARFYR